MLEELRWECVYNSCTGVGTGLCIPIDSQAFLSVGINFYVILEFKIYDGFYNNLLYFCISSFLNGRTQDGNQLPLCHRNL
jgi:hypothetical protein